MLAGLATGLLSNAAVAASPAAVPQVPTRGFNLPRWIDRRDGIAPAPAVLEELRSRGFATIRLPVDPDLVGAEDATDRAAALKAADTAIRVALAAGFKVIVDMHPSGDLDRTFASDPEAAARRAIIGWTYLRDVIADQPAKSVYAELLNEPPLERADWLPLRDELAATVRGKCPHHTLIWGPSRVQGIWELAGAPPLPDSNAIAAVHYYTPMGFTHQCENWDASPLAQISNLPFPATRNGKAVEALASKFEQADDDKALKFLDGEFAGPWTTAHIEADFAVLGRWSKANRCPVMLDEFGVLDFCVDPVSRATWVRAVRRAAEANGAGWAYWEVDAGFGFIADRRSPEGFSETMIAALVGA